LGNEDSSTVTVRVGSDEALTAQALPRAAHERRRNVSVSGTTHYTLATLRDEEVRTARTMISVGRAVGVAAVLPLPFLGGSAVLRIMFAIAAALAIAVGLIVERQIRDPERYRERTMLILAASVLPAGFAGLLYWGIFSAVQLFPVLALYFFSRRERFRSALAIYLVTAAGQAAIAAAVIAQLVPDLGLFEPQLSVGTLVVGHLLIQVGDLAAFVLGWYSHRATRAAIEDMQNAMVLAAKREALLHEARQDLDRAMGVGNAGRYTDQEFGSYRLGNVLGRGGMGEIYEARHVNTDQPAAVKLLAPRELGNPHSVERFVREVRAVSTLASEHVVRVLGASDDRDPIPYLVMERLHGQDLARLLRDTRLPHDQLLELLDHVGAAVTEAWEHGIVHRDLKPSNLFRAEHPGGWTWKVLDFGVAALSDHAGTLTQGHVVGTPTYMAPEQARGERVDHRADIYALSAITYRWLTGRPVCSGKDLPTSLYQIVHLHPTPPSALAELDPDVDAVLAIGLAKDPAKRWERVVELRDALRDALAGRLAPRLRQRAANLA
jgi:serine/threonine-protein kinase